MRILDYISLFKRIANKRAPQSIDEWTGFVLYRAIKGDLKDKGLIKIPTKIYDEVMAKLSEIKKDSQ